MDPTPAFLHVGFSKTGTTWLQQELFPAIPGWKFLRPDPVFRPLIANLISAPDEAFRKRTFEAFLSEVAQPPGTGLIVSNERLIEQTRERSASRAAQRLRMLFPRARVLIVVRHQVDMIRSLYVQYIHEGGHAAFRRFLACDDNLSLSSLEYHRFVADYQALWGKENVLVLPYELMVERPRDYLRSIGEFGGFPIPELSDETLARQLNRGLSPASRQVLRAWNRSFRRSLHNPKPAIAAVRGASHARSFLQRYVDPLFNRPSRALSPADERYLAEIAQRYADSNGVLEELAGVDLRRFGYPVNAARLDGEGRLVS